MCKAKVTLCLGSHILAYPYKNLKNVSKNRKTKLCVGLCLLESGDSNQVKPNSKRDSLKSESN